MDESSNFIRFNSNNPSLNDLNNRKSDIVVEWTDSVDFLFFLFFYQNKLF